MIEGKLNIIGEKLISLTSTDYTNEAGFFFNAKTAGDVCYVPMGIADTGAITRTFDASNDYYIVMCRKILKSGTTATTIYVGTGLV